MAFTYSRTIRLADTDAAGVVFFARHFAICHEAYEESLAASGIELAGFFQNTGVAVPITKSEAEYLRPLRAGEKVRVSVVPELLSDESFAIRFEMRRDATGEKIVARIRTEHVANSPAKHARAPLPPPLRAWVDAG